MSNASPNYEGYQQSNASAPLLQQPQGYPPQQQPQGYPPQQQPQGYPPQQQPQGYPPLQQPQGYQPLQQPQGYQPLQQPQGYQPLQQPQGYPPLQQPYYGSIQNATVVGEQPHTPAVTVVPQKPNNYVGLSVFTLLCCCWLFGIIALVYGLKVDSASASGDVVAATSASQSARSWNIAGIVFGSVVVGGVVLINIISIPIALSRDHTNCYNCTY